MNRVLAKINRTTFDRIFSSIDVIKKRVVKAQHIDFSKCPHDCKYKNNGYICSEHCSNYTLIDINNDTINEKTIFIEKYINDSLLSKDAKTLSKSQILQFIYYHFLPLTAKGKYEYVSEKSISDILNINIKTVRRNNDVLKALGLIDYQKEETGFFNLQINNYEQAFNKDSKGTVNIPYNFFEIVKDFDNIDMIKIALFLYAEHFSFLRDLKDENVIKRVLLKKVKKIIAKGKNYKKYIFTILDNLSNLFKIEKESENRIIRFKTLPKFLCYKVVEKNNTETIAKISTFFKDNLIDKYLSQTVYDDLIQLASQYGIDIMLEGLNVLKLNISSINKANFNIGAIVRSEIKNLLAF